MIEYGIWHNVTEDCYKKRQKCNKNVLGITTWQNYSRNNGSKTNGQSNIYSKVTELSEKAKQMK